MKAFFCRSVARLPRIGLPIAALSFFSLFAGQVRLVDLEQMTQRAARIFSGRCIAATSEFDVTLGREVTVATFHVHRAVKGSPGRTVTVRMLAEASGAGAPRRPGVEPLFRAGEEVVLFLYGESGLGLTSPVGLGQGYFKVGTDKNGRSRAINNLGNRSLLTGLRPETRARLQADRDPRAGRAVQVREDDLDPEALLDAAEALGRQDHR